MATKAKKSRFGHLGYCPYEDVQVSLPCELYGLWTLIGEKIVCIPDDEKHDFNKSEVIKFFSSDEILSSIILYAGGSTEKIEVHLSHDPDGMETFSQNNKFYDKKVISVRGKKSATVLCRNSTEPNTIYLFAWDTNE